ncbi:hypothetical protein H8B09_14430 [Paenibacillus sp. PR3]|uniref:Uncharacterized protein n=1 Tax=Paenibacillus terricola TaxID=2763503 RepID=A0ABR8MY24_9BACL|nr:hypothetical protein [Paenibacillus terricola]MBD3919957.1 hypothetical protein [Paenibacillus terricola]
MHLRWRRLLLPLVVVVSILSSGCGSKVEEVVVDVPTIPAEDAIRVEGVQTRDIALDEDRTTMNGIRYDVILTTEMSERQMRDIGVGLQFKGETQQFWGMSGSGYSTGYSLLERTDTGTRIQVSFDLLRDTATKEQLNKLKSKEALSDVDVKLFYKGAAYTTLPLSHL